MAKKRPNPFTGEFEDREVRLQQLITLENDACNASAIVHSHPIINQFVPSDGVYQFIDGEYVDLTGDRYLYMNHFWTVDTNFTIQLIGYNLQDKVVHTYLKRSDNNDYIKIWYDRTEQLIKADKKSGLYLLPFRSKDKIDIPYGAKFSMLITNINGRLGLSAKLI